MTPGTTLADPITMKSYQKARKMDVHFNFVQAGAEIGNFNNPILFHLNTNH